MNYHNLVICLIFVQCKATAQPPDLGKPSTNRPRSNGEIALVDGWTGPDWTGLDDRSSDRFGQNATARKNSLALASLWSLISCWLCVRIVFGSRSFVAGLLFPRPFCQKRWPYITIWISDWVLIAATQPNHTCILPALCSSCSAAAGKRRCWCRLDLDSDLLGVWSLCCAYMAKKFNFTLLY